MTGLLVVAHRAGNDPADLRAAEALGVDMVEADLHLFRGRVEVRHLKTLGPVPLLWDRWRLASPFTPRRTLDDLLELAEPATGLLLDLKGADPRLSARVIDALDRRGGTRRVAVCARNWWLLGPFAGRPDVSVVHTIATARRLRRVVGRGWRRGAISVNERLLTPPALAGLRAVTAEVVAWGVRDRGRLDELVAAGVAGVITADRGVLRAALGKRATPAPFPLTGGCPGRAACEARL